MEHTTVPVHLHMFLPVCNVVTQIKHFVFNQYWKYDFEHIFTDYIDLVLCLFANNTNSAIFIRLNWFQFRGIWQTFLNKNMWFDWNVRTNFLEKKIQENVVLVYNKIDLNGFLYVYSYLMKKICNRNEKSKRK